MSDILAYNYGSHLIDWLLLGGLFVVSALWIWHTSKVRLY